MTKRLTLRGPSSEFTVETEDSMLFERFLKWLKFYNPAPVVMKMDYYPIKTEQRIIICRIKARKLNLKVK